MPWRIKPLSLNNRCHSSVRKNSHLQHKFAYPFLHQITIILKIFEFYIYIKCNLNMLHNFYFRIYFKRQSKIRVFHSKPATGFRLSEARQVEWGPMTAVRHVLVHSRCPARGSKSRTANTVKARLTSEVRSVVSSHLSLQRADISRYANTEPINLCQLYIQTYSSLKVRLKHAQSFTVSLQLKWSKPPPRTTFEPMCTFQPNFERGICLYI